MKLHSIVNDLRFLNTLREEHFKHKILRELFIHSNTATSSSAAIEQLLSVGKDVLKPKRRGLTDQHFELLIYLKRWFLTFFSLALFFRGFHSLPPTCPNFSLKIGEEQKKSHHVRGSPFFSFPALG